MARRPLVVSLLVAMSGAMAIACGSFSASDDQSGADASLDGATSTADDSGGSSLQHADAAADAGASSRCLADAGTALLSADFEESPPRYYVLGTPGGLTPAVAPTTWTVDSEDGGSTCGANALEIDMKGAPYMLVSQAVALGFTAHTMTAKFDLRVDSLDVTVEDETIATIGLRNPGFGDCYVSLQILTAGAKDFGLQSHCGTPDKNQYVDHVIKNPVGLGWLRVVFALDLGNQVATISLDGGQAITLPLVADAKAGGATGYTSIGLNQGPAADAGAQSRIRLDNIRVDVE